MKQVRTVLGAAVGTPAGWLFYGIGWVAAVVVAGVLWAVAAVRLGWTDARGHS